MKLDFNLNRLTIDHLTVLVVGLIVFFFLVVTVQQTAYVPVGRRQLPRGGVTQPQSGITPPYPPASGAGGF